MGCGLSFFFPFIFFFHFYIWFSVVSKFVTPCLEYSMVNTATITLLKACTLNLEFSQPGARRARNRFTS